MALSFDLSEVEVALTGCDVLDVLGSDFTDTLVLYLGQFSVNEGVTLGNRVLAREVHEVLFECH